MIFGFLLFFICLRLFWLIFNFLVFIKVNIIYWIILIYCRLLLMIVGVKGFLDKVFDKIICLFGFLSEFKFVVSCDLLEVIVWYLFFLYSW